MEKSSENENIIFAGDFNARVGTQSQVAPVQKKNCHNNGASLIDSAYLINQT
jgi:hypothetical protein